MKKNSLLIVILVILSLILAACAPKPVVEEGTTVTFWHVYGEGKPSEGVVTLVEEFNTTNEWGITVDALDQVDYSPMEDKFNAAIQSGDLPDVVMGYTNALSDWYSVGAIADLNPFISDPDYGLTETEIADIYESAYNAGVTSDGARVAFPLTQSANVLVYNFTWAEELGFDSPPKTSAEFKEQVCAASEFNDSLGGDFAGTGGLVYYPSTTNWLNWYFAFGGDTLNDAGDGYDFTDQAAVDASLFLNDLRDSGCTFETESYPNPEQAQRLALVTMSSTAGLPYYEVAFEEAENDDVWGFIGAPGPDGTLAVDAFQQMIGIVPTTEEKQMASWLFVRWLTSPEIQARWIADYSGYLPTQGAAMPLLESFAAENTVWATGAELAKLGPAEPQTFPAWSPVRREIGDYAAQLFEATSEDEIKTILEALNVSAADLVEEVQ